MITAGDSILRVLGDQSRYVLVPWRALVILRQATVMLNPAQRRWKQLPELESDLSAILRGMRKRGEISLLTETPRSYQITTPYARKSSPSPTELLLELNPYGAISHASALTFHGLSLDLPERITAMTPSTGRFDLIPVGTEEADWDGLLRPSGFSVSNVLGTHVSWQRTKVEHFFGVATYREGDIPIYVTTPERTLVEGLRSPDACGGIINVLSSWSRARWTLDVESIIATVNRFNVGILRQRVGYVLESLGFSHQELIRWQRSARRGGSSRLVASEPFLSTFSARWSLSLNGPVHLLGEEM